VLIGRPARFWPATLCDVEAGYVAETLRLAAPVRGVMLQEGSEVAAQDLDLAPAQVAQASYTPRGCATVAAGQRLGQHGGR